ncbi:MAG: glycosyltransferase family 2 protein [Candidatus Celaenobacter antarcticus]|nr:glycosyltransferase family 2 protein [Candidatus Celaenobacter antarcticus]MDP8315505.1 glycosyltransferase family 2 protein [Candidatus Celaenobacter antarcticus]
MGWIIAFWISSIVLFYVYFGYPILILFLSKLLPKPFAKFSEEELQDGSLLPAISIFIPAYNEEPVIEKKIRNTLDLDYPKDKIEIIVASDGSDDKTVEIANLYSDKIQLMAYDVREGKTGLINKTIPKLKGEIIIFSDASAMLAVNALKELISPFKDPKIGSVSGLYILRDATSTSRAEGEGFYWHYETFLKTNESTFYSILGAHGALYALRKSLFRALPPKAINDDYILPMYGVQQKRRAVYEPNAVAVEEGTTSVLGEMKRRIRISVGNFQQLFLLRKLLNPFRGRIAFEFLSHKFLRSFSFLLMIILFISNIFIPTTGFRIFFLLQIFFYLLGLSGVIFFKNKRMPVLITVPFYLVIINYAAFIGLFKYIFNTQKVTWEKPQ